MKTIASQQAFFLSNRPGIFGFGRNRRAAFAALVALVGVQGLAHGGMFDLGPANQIRVQLGGNSIMQAPAGNLELALRRAVAARPKAASLLLSEVLSVKRSDMPKLAPRLVVAAIRGLGPNPTLPEVVNLVQIAITLRPEDELIIVKYAMAATPKEFFPALAGLLRTPLDEGAGGSAGIASSKGTKATGKEVVPLEGNWLWSIRRELKEIAPLENNWGLGDGWGFGEDGGPTLDSLLAQEGPLAIPQRPPHDHDILPPHVPHDASH